MLVLIGKSIALLALLAVSLLGPGALVLRRYCLPAADRFIGAVLVSTLLLYLASLAAFAFRLPERVSSIVILAGAAACTIASARSLRTTLASRPVVRMFLIFACLFLWTFLLMGLVRHFAGGGWSGDWYRQYDKSQLLLHRTHLPIKEAEYRLIERPPLQNLVSILYMGVVGEDFPMWQVLCLFFGLLVVVPAYWLRREMTPGLRVPWTLAAALLACSPMLVENATYTWTKSLGGCFAAIGTGFYLAAIRKNDPVRFVLAAAALVGGIMIHYLVIPFAAFFAVHSLHLIVRGRGRGLVRAVVPSAVVTVVLVAPWFAWVFSAYGLNDFVGAGARLRGTRNISAYDKALVIAHNVIDNFAPHPFRTGTNFYDQENPFGFVRDYTFLIYQTNAVTCLGSVASLLVLWLVYRHLAYTRSPGRRTELLLAVSAGFVVILLATFHHPSARLVFELFPRYAVFALALLTLGFLVSQAYRVLRAPDHSARWEVWFWRGWIFFAYFVSIPLTMTGQMHGLAHVFLIAPTMMGLVFLAAHLPYLSRGVRRLLAGGMVLDFLVGIALQFGLQNLVFGPVGVGGKVERTHGLLEVTRTNWMDKETVYLVFWGDPMYPARYLLWALIGIGFVIAIVQVLKVRRAGTNGWPHSGHRAVEALRS